MAEQQLQQPAGIKPLKLLRRVITAVGYGAVVLAGIFFGGYPPLGRFGPVVLGCVLGVFAGFASSEFYAMERREARLPNEAFGVVVAILMPIAAAFWGMAGLSSAVTALIAASLVWHVVFVRVRTVDTATTVFGAVYTGFLLSYLVLILRGFHGDLPGYREGQLLALTVVISVWLNDSLAYLVGSTLGRHKLVPRISPKKSWEGFIAGLLGTVATWVVVAVLVPQADIPVVWAMLTGVVVGIAVLVGDLFESRLKREAGVKDSGNTLPGHGGFLDRLDSLILVALVAYWMLWWGGLR